MMLAPMTQDLMSSKYELFLHMEYLRSLGTYES